MESIVVLPVSRYPLKTGLSAIGTSGDVFHPFYYLLTPNHALTVNDNTVGGQD